MQFLQKNVKKTLTVTIDGQVRLVRLLTDNLRLFLHQQTDKQVIQQTSICKMSKQ
jgi:hypothetical protein